MNYIWFFLIIISFIVGFVNGKLDLVVNSILQSTQKTVEITLYLVGIMAFWLGIMKIAQKSGLVELISKAVKPMAKYIFPEIPENSEVLGDVTMNFTANALGLSNAATPMGLKAISGMQKLNKEKKSASNSMCMLLAMNTAGFQLIPATVIAILLASGYKNPTEIIAPTIIVTLIDFLSAIILAKVFEKFWRPQNETEEKK